jgi:hypothetical protein
MLHAIQFYYKINRNLSKILIKVVIGNIKYNKFNFFKILQPIKIFSKHIIINALVKINAK